MSLKSAFEMKKGVNNVGSNCSHVVTGLCRSNTHKFKCSNTNPVFTTVPRDEISETKGSKYEGEKQYRNEDCHYVEGFTPSKFGSNIVDNIRSGLNYNPFRKTSAGKKSKRKTPKSKRRSTKRK
uniref:Uncharacterized protein n=1 Tax=viral metagenome TaxID=1070528 RepID=A0A6C0H1Z6_9ZZZZ